MEPQPKFNLSSQLHNLDRSSLQTTYLWTREYSGGNVVASNAVFLEGAQHEPTMFERLLHTVARKAHRKGDNMDELKIRQWQEDDKSVRDGTCSFQVQYLGSAEVPQSKGVQLCENVIKILKHAESQPRKRNEPTTSQWATMHITSAKIIVVEDDSQKLIVEDPIKSISFCCAHRRYEKCFAYISRLNATEHRWICHAFSAITASGERLNHAVGCAFDACHAGISQSANNNKPDEVKRTDTAADTARHHGASKPVAIPTDVSKLPDPSIARPRPSADAQKGQPEAQGHVTLEMDVMK